MTRLKISMVKSLIGCSARQRATLRGLGLRGIGSQSELENTPAVRGMIKAVIHVLSVEEVGAAAQG